MSLPALPTVYRPQNTAIFGNKPPDWPNTCPTAPGGLISGSHCSDYYFDPSSASRGLSVARSRLSWTYSSPDDLIRPDNDLVVYQVKFWSSSNLSVDFSYSSVLE